jgi:hypothetical protein
MLDQRDDRGEVRGSKISGTCQQTKLDRVKFRQRGDIIGVRPMEACCWSQSIPTDWSGSTP